jgi:hypothetical protein
VLCCFDARIRPATDDLLRRQLIDRPDMIVLAGGALRLASPRNNFDRDFVLQQIGLGIQLHQAKRLLLMSHSDCATYGGLASFNHNADKERAHHRQQLCAASAIAQAAFPALAIERLFVTFDGVFSVEDPECAETASSAARLRAT